MALLKALWSFSRESWVLTRTDEYLLFKTQKNKVARVTCGEVDGMWARQKSKRQTQIVAQTCASRLHWQPLRVRSLCGHPSCFFALCLELKSLLRPLKVRLVYQVFGCPSALIMHVLIHVTYIVIILVILIKLQQNLTILIWESFFFVFFFCIEIIWWQNTWHSGNNTAITFMSLVARFQNTASLHQANFHILINAVVICLLLFTDEQSQKHSSISHWEASFLTENGELLVSQSKQWCYFPYN